MLSAEENVTLSVELPMIAGLLRHTVTAEDDAAAELVTSRTGSSRATGADEQAKEKN
jgi:hypothetical protein